MANRFLDTNYYKSPFVRALKGSLKSLYSFIICDCDGAGIWNLDLAAASLYTGFEISSEEFDSHFIRTGKAVSIGKNKFFFPDFIEHQYPKGLQEKNPAHKNFIATLKKFQLVDKDLIVKKGAKEELQSSTSNGNGNSQGYGNGIGNGQDGGLGEEKYVIPKMCKIWYEKFPKYTGDKKNDFDGMGSILQFITRQANVTAITDPEIQETILNTLQMVADEVLKEVFWINKPIKSIANNIQEFYNKIKNPLNGKSSTSAGAKTNGYYGKDAGQKVYADELAKKLTELDDN